MKELNNSVSVVISNDPVVVEGIQIWGRNPSWSIETEYPKVVAIQCSYDHRLFSIEDRTYNEYGHNVSTVVRCTVPVSAISISSKVYDWKDYTEFPRV